MRKNFNNHLITDKTFSTFLFTSHKGVQKWLFRKANNFFTFLKELAIFRFLLMLQIVTTNSDFQVLWIKSSPILWSATVSVLIWMNHTVSEDDSSAANPTMVSGTQK